MTKSNDQPFIDEAVEDIDKINLENHQASKELTDELGEKAAEIDNADDIDDTKEVKESEEPERSEKSEKLEATTDLEEDTKVEDTADSVEDAETTETTEATDTTEFDKPEVSQASEKTPEPTTPVAPVATPATTDTPDTPKPAKKKRSMVGYFIGMLFVFLAFFLIQQVALTIFYSNYTNFKFGKEVISEAIWAVLVLVVILIYKNSYIFTDKKEKLSKSLHLGLPLIIISSIFLLLGLLGTTKPFSIPVVLNLATYCILIGIVEEFMVRGWILNEFLERFSDSKKHIILSIVLSSLIFGAVHIFNVGQQSLLVTLIQVVNATFLGMIFALIYYKTKNIWSVVLIHAFWDFALYLPTSVYLGPIVYGEETSAIKIYSLVRSIILVVALGILCFCYFKKTKIVETDKVEEKSNLYNFILPAIAIIVYLGSDFIVPPEFADYAQLVEYETKSIGADFEVHYFMHDEYVISEEYTVTDEEKNKCNVPVTECEDVESVDGEQTECIDEVPDLVYNKPNEAVTDCLPTYTEPAHYDFKLYKDDAKLALKNLNTEESVILYEDATTLDYLLLENEDSYAIFFYDMLTPTVAYYINFQKADISDEKAFLDSIKDAITEYDTPNIANIGVVSTPDGNFAFISTEINDRLFIGTDKVMYLAE